MSALRVPRRRHDPHPPAFLIFDAKARARFWSKVSPAPADACWIWRGAYSNSGYGSVAKMINGRQFTYLAHRVAYELTKGAIPAGLDLDHTCRNKHCVNPGHLDAVTFLVNMRRRYTDKPDERGTHCWRGHELTAANTVVRRTGQRTCRTCYPRQAKEVTT